MRWLALLPLMACSDSGWETFATNQAALQCRYQEVCAASTEGLDCDAYIDQFEPLPDPCVRYDAEFASACIEQLQDLLEEVRDNPSSCPADPERFYPSCELAWVEAAGGPCRSAD